MPAAVLQHGYRWFLLVSCLAYKAATCAVQTAEPDRLMHGNYCGTGGTAGRTPTDALGFACKRHDDCYGVRGTNDCLCDRTLVTEVTNLATSGQLYAGAVEKATIIAAYSGARIQTCPAQ